MIENNVDQKWSPRRVGAEETALQLANKIVDPFIGERLRERRVEVRLTQEDAAHSAGISLHLLKEAEAGRARLGAGAIVRLSIVLEVAPSWFFQDFD